MKISRIIMLMVFLTIYSVAGQNEEATTKSGKKVILNSNGTWKYVETKKDSIKANTTKCSKWITTETDKVTGSTTTAAKKSIVVSNDGGKKGLGIFMLNDSEGGLILLIQAVGASNCIDKGSKINILFVDGSRLELQSDGKFNCQGEATVYFGGIFGKEIELEELKTKKIETMRVWTNDSFVEKDFTNTNQDEFLNVINCLTK